MDWWFLSQLVDILKENARCIVFGMEMAFVGNEFCHVVSFCCVIWLRCATHVPLHNYWSCGEKSTHFLIQVDKAEERSSSVILMYVWINICWV